MTPAHERFLRPAFWLLVLALGALRFWHLTADFPNHTMWGIDQAKFTDEGWWANSAVDVHLTGLWTVPGDYNPGVALPVWPALLALLFHWTGVSLVAARALNVVFSLGTVAAVWLLMRRWVEERGSMMAVLLLVSSPFAFVFSRLATLDTLVILLACGMMLAATWMEARRVVALATLALLATAMVLTKTTAVVFLPGIVCLAWMCGKPRAAKAAQLALALGAIPAALFLAYRSFVSRIGFETDYRYFFATNGMEDVDWGHVPATILTLLRNGVWIDRVLYPLAILVLVLSLTWLRELWKNPLFTASWVVIVCQAAFIFRKQEDYAPRYWLVFLLPVIFCIVLTLDRLRGQFQRAYQVGFFALAAVVLGNAVTIVEYSRQPTYDFYDAAVSIRKIVTARTDTKPLMLGVSASQFSLATGIPSINDAFGSQDLDARVLKYRPGWYLVWNKIGAESKDALPPFQLQRVASYPMFDDRDRDELILYRIVDAGGR